MESGIRRAKFGLLSLFVLLVLLVVASKVLRHEPARVLTAQLAVPAYISPSTSPATWTRLLAAPSGTVGVVVVNVMNGPDTAADRGWADVIRRAHRKGITVLGYVDSGYFGTTGDATRSGATTTAAWTAQIQADVDSWYSYYGDAIGGIFFDKALNTCGPVPGSNAWADLYTAASASAKRTHPGAMTVINPGTSVPQCFSPSADALLTFEGNYQEYIAATGSSPTAYSPVPWAVESKRLWHVIYGVPTATDMERVLALSKTRGAGFVYATDADLPNPYDTLPPDRYWTKEISHVGPARA